MENAFSFMPNYLQMASCFVHGETFNQQESMMFWQFSSLAGCVRIFMLVHFERIFSLAKFEFPARTPDESRLKFQDIID